MFINYFNGFFDYTHYFLYFRLTSRRTYYQQTTCQHYLNDASSQTLGTKVYNVWIKYVSAFTDSSQFNIYSIMIFFSPGTVSCPLVINGLGLYATVPHSKGLLESGPAGLGRNEEEEGLSTLKSP